MDDYLLELLKSQEQEQQRSKAEMILEPVQVPRAAVERADLPSILAAETQQEQRQETSLRIWMGMEPVALPVGESGSATQRPVSETYLRQEQSPVWKQNAAPGETGSAAADPEALSMFYQRDARRYT